MLVFVELWCGIFIPWCFQNRLLQSD